MTTLIRRYWILIPSFLLLTILLIYTRFVNLGWGLPYPFHPDERNIAWAIMKLSPVNYFKPDFYAYGQFTLYLSYVIITISKMVYHLPPAITYEEATIALRAISALSSCLTAMCSVYIVWILMKVQFTHSSLKKRMGYSILASLIAIFMPVAIQFAHFGTTESLLMLLYTLLIAISLRVYIRDMTLKKYYMYAALITGISIATKISAFLYVLLPIYVYFISIKPYETNVKLKEFFFTTLRFSIVVGYLGFLFSPYNLLAFVDFLGSMHYESDVGLGRALVFYTRQFFMTTPVMYQIDHVLPYALSWSVFILSVAGLFFLPRTKHINMLRIAFIIVFLPNAFMYTKWTRFLAPVYPLLSILATITCIAVVERLNTLVLYFKELRIVTLSITAVLILAMIVPGVAYVSIYSNPLVHYTASDWIYKHIPERSTILSETANVIDLPISPPGVYPPDMRYNYISFNSYDIENDPLLKTQFEQDLKLADYIFVPSRRVFYNHTCERDVYPFVTPDAKRCATLQRMYPTLNEYYYNLFKDNLPFREVARFTSFPEINIGGITVYSSPDEDAEETWTVFDHPVVRIYKRIK